MKIILGSKSPRRQELLKQIGVSYQCIISEKEEVVTSHLPEEVVLELSAMKAEDVEGQILDENIIEDESLIIAADTIVAYGDQILGKPKDEEDAFCMLKNLQGNVHQVYTGVSVIYRSGDRRKVLSFVECTNVTVKSMTDTMLRRYIATKEPMDKAGAYGIQGLFAVYVEKIEGDYNNVVGLPIARIYTEVLEQFGIDIRTGEHKTKACIFDLDGTTLDTIESIAHTANQVLQKLGLQEHSEAEYKMFVGEGQVKLIERALRASGDTELENFDRAMAEYIEMFKVGCMYHVKPYQGIMELLQALKAQGIKIAILSNKAHENTCSAVETVFGAGYFDYVLGHKPEYPRKPGIEGLKEILRNLEVEPEECLYIGDTAIDMKTGKTGGMFTLGVSWGFRKTDELVCNGADAILEHPMDLLGYIR